MIRIQYARYVLGVVFIFHCREVVTLVRTEVNFATGLRTPQTQRVGRVGVVTRDYLIVSDSQNLFGFDPARFYLPAECDHQNGLIARVVAFGISHGLPYFQPVVRRLFLATVNDVLLEHTVVIADAVTAPRQP